MWKNYKGRKLAGLCLLFIVLFNYPVFSIFIKEGTLFGMPRNYITIFILWLLMISLLAIVSESGPSSQKEDR